VAVPSSTSRRPSGGTWRSSRCPFVRPALAETSSSAASTCFEDRPVPDPGAQHDQRGDRVVAAEVAERADARVRDLHLPHLARLADGRAGVRAQPREEVRHPGVAGGGRGVRETPDRRRALVAQPHARLPLREGEHLLEQRAQDAFVREVCGGLAPLLRRPRLRRAGGVRDQARDLGVALARLEQLRRPLAPVVAPEERLVELARRFGLEQLADTLRERGALAAVDGGLVAVEPLRGSAQRLFDGTHAVLAAVEVRGRDRNAEPVAAEPRRLAGEREPEELVDVVGRVRELAACELGRERPGRDCPVPDDVPPRRGGLERREDRRDEDAARLFEQLPPGLALERRGLPVARVEDRLDERPPPCGPVDRTPPQRLQHRDVDSRV